MQLGKCLFDAQIKFGKIWSKIDKVMKDFLQGVSNHKLINMTAGLVAPSCEEGKFHYALSKLRTFGMLYILNSKLIFII